MVAGPPASVTIAPDSTGVLVGATTTFTATAKDAANNSVATTFTWASSDPTIATVDANGVATGVAEGAVTITATSANNIAGTAKLSVTPSGGVADHTGEIVISQIYGGGGNAGSTFKNDFVELFNRSTHAVDVTGWSVQYASRPGRSRRQHRSPGRSRREATISYKRRSAPVAPSTFRRPTRRARSAWPAAPERLFSFNPLRRLASRVPQGSRSSTR